MTALLLRANTRTSAPRLPSSLTTAEPTRPTPPITSVFIGEFVVPWFAAALVKLSAAIDVDDLSGDEGRVLRGQEVNCADEVFRLLVAHVQHYSGELG